MKILDTRFKDCFLIKPDVHRDSRGFFFRKLSTGKISNFLGLKDPLVQDNFSRSSFGTLRGLHFQKKIRKVSL